MERRPGARETAHKIACSGGQQVRFLGGTIAKVMDTSAEKLEPKLMDRSETMSMSGDGNPDVKVGPIPGVVYCLSALPIMWPFQLMSGWVCLNPNEAVAITHCGEVTSLKTRPGCYPVLCAGSEHRRVSTKQTAANLEAIKVVDAVGAPVMVSAIMNYQVVDPLRAMYSVDNYHENVMVNAQAVLKMVVGQYSYNELKSQTERINESLRTQMEPTVTRSGVHIISMYLNELNYAPEIASAMLKKQQAGALIEARQLIVDGAVRIANDAVTKIQETGTIQMNDQDKVKIVTNLLTVTCSDTDTTPTVSL